MLYWSIIFLVIAIVAAVLGFGGIAGTPLRSQDHLLYFFGNIHHFVVRWTAATGLAYFLSLPKGMPGASTKSIAAILNSLIKTSKDDHEYLRLPREKSGSQDSALRTLYATHGPGRASPPRK